MVWAMAEMMKNPTVLKKAQEEVRGVVGSNARVQPDDVPKLKYLKMVVKETLRLHPTVPLLVPSETLRHIKICGYDVPTKTRVFVNVWAIGRDPTSWDSRGRTSTSPGRTSSSYRLVLVVGCALELPWEWPRRSSLWPTCSVASTGSSQWG